MKRIIWLATAALFVPMAASMPSQAAPTAWHTNKTSAEATGATDRPLVLVNGPRRGGGNSQNFNSNNFHSNVSRSSNTNVNRNANVNVNRNVNVHGGGCCNNYNSGPGWGGVAAGVAVGTVVGAAAASTVRPPPPYYPPATVYVPAY
jgi:hypothetical protein